MIKKLLIIFCMIFLVVSINAGNYKFQNQSGADLMTLYGDTGNLSVMGNINATGEVYNKEAPILPIGTILMFYGNGIVDVGSRTEDIGDRAGDTISMPSWKVANGMAGTPNLTNSFIRGMVSSGNTGGSDDAVVVSHSHSIDHDHASLSSGTQSASHTHTGTSGEPSVPNTGGQSQAHTHSGTTGGITANHQHSELTIHATSGTQIDCVNGGTNDCIYSIGTNTGWADRDHTHVVTTGLAVDHTHSMQGHTHTTTTGVQSASHSHTVDLPNFVGTSGITGSPETGVGKNMPKYYSVIFIKRMN